MSREPQLSRTQYGARNTVQRVECVSTTTHDRTRWAQMIRNFFGDTLVPVEYREQLLQLLVHHDQLFSLDEGEQCETKVVEFEIDTGNSPPPHLTSLADALCSKSRGCKTAEGPTTNRSGPSIIKSMDKPRYFGLKSLRISQRGDTTKRQ